ncbi:MAG: ESCRT-0 subunit protein hse1 [Watsoniomyces obsoletus]|nr:MAG: ESCRT-0 subunit protein hse1 [Watsoniomyces obsoletus]
MFRAQQNPFDEAVAKATDENLTSENWEYIMDVCDKVMGEESGAKDVVASLIKRMAHRNANVQLYTLELANALSQNCGAKMHRELSSRSFTDALLRLANDRNTHTQVKAKILERMAEWAEMFASNPDLGIMEQQYMRLKSQNPNLHPPSKPRKQEITDIDRRKEEEELQMALALSIKDRPSGGNGVGGTSSSSSTRPGVSSSGFPIAIQSSSNNNSAPSQPVPSGTTAATVSRVRALFDFQPSEPGELQFRKGDVIAVLESVYKDWWKGSLRGSTGIFPLNYVEKLSDPTPEELAREAQVEAEVFAEIKNVEKLLTLLSTSSSELNVQENDEITTLYHSTLAIRPKLIELIGKYSQKKDDFTQLNEKFIKARRDYENLLEASMAQPVQPTYAGRQAAAGGGGATPSPYPPYGGAGRPDPAGRYYTSTPGVGAGGGGPQELSTDPHSPLPTNGPAPFYLVGQQQQQQQHPSQPPSQSGYVAPPLGSPTAGAGGIPTVLATGHAPPSSAAIGGGYPSQPSYGVPGGIMPSMPGSPPPPSLAGQGQAQGSGPYDTHPGPTAPVGGGGGYQSYHRPTSSSGAAPHPSSVSVPGPGPINEGRYGMGGEGGRYQSYPGGPTPTQSSIHAPGPGPGPGMGVGAGVGTGLTSHPIRPGTGQPPGQENGGVGAGAGFNPNEYYRQAGNVPGTGYAGQGQQGQQGPANELFLPRDGGAI